MNKEEDPGVVGEVEAAPLDDLAASSGGGSDGEDVSDEFSTVGSAVGEGEAGPAVSVSVEVVRMDPAAEGELL